MSSRRRFLSAASLAAAGLALAPLAACSRDAPAPQASTPASTAPRPTTAAGGLTTRAIPATGETVPVIGAGTSGSYEIALDSPDFARLQDTIRVFFEGGATLFDTSPNYTNADEVLGALLAAGGWRDRCFLATKIAADDRPTMEAQWTESQRRLQTDHVELLQIHNLRALDIAWPYAQQLKEAGATKYIGLTHYLESGHAALVEAMRRLRPDFVQVNYSVNAPQAARTVLPVAQELGIAVLINRAFDDGKLFARVSDTVLPDWAEAVGVTSWSQMFLKFAISHPAVTAVIPATGRPDRQADQLRAGTGPLLSEAQQAELVAQFA
ncbi:aldo/keto reductase [Luteimonas sp. 3794]|uniref:aldo/keto reductase n=1 Tax=Luteimonas sp. 3794 TaxID=2817730 RepID=UPI002866C8CB|nr:aldo/keto reductase [Luteimonas sp. 3794]MDR6992774.1 aryl-alcohol dehydrogenase-like predicted oxidoreductase [Luteimonas sp. 3794]